MFEDRGPRIIEQTVEEAWGQAGGDEAWEVEERVEEAEQAVEDEAREVEVIVEDDFAVRRPPSPNARRSPTPPQIVEDEHIPQPPPPQQPHPQERGKHWGAGARNKLLNTNKTVQS